MSAVFFWAVALPAVAFIIHTLWWRLALPRRQTRALLLLFFSCLLLLPLAIVFSDTLPAQLTLTGAGALRVAVWHVAATLAYVITYSAVEAQSPSLVMVLRIANAGSAGLSRQTFVDEMNDDVLVMPRIRDLVRDGLVIESPDENSGFDVLTISAKGVRFIRIFEVQRRLLAARRKGG